MKKIALVMLFAAVSCAAFSQENRAAFSVSPEFNMNSRSNFAGGLGFSFDANLLSSFAIGAAMTINNNFQGINITEPFALFRWYFLGKGHSGFFAQADIGGWFTRENDEVIPLVLGGLRVGFRKPFGASFYIEPYARGGYPFVFGVGIAVGSMGF